MTYSRLVMPVRRHTDLAAWVICSPSDVLGTDLFLLGRVSMLSVHLKSDEKDKKDAFLMHPALSQGGPTDADETSDERDKRRLWRKAGGGEGRERRRGEGGA